MKKQKSIEMTLLVQTVIAAVGSIFIIIDSFFHWLPPLSAERVSIIWVVVGIIVLVLMGLSGGRIYKGLGSTLIARSATMDTLIGLGTGMAWLYSMIVILAPNIIPDVARHQYFDTA